MYPLTRARTSAISTASSRPVYSSHSITSRRMGLATVTAGGGNVCATAFSLHPAINSSAANNDAPTKTAGRPPIPCSVINSFRPYLLRNDCSRCRNVRAIAKQTLRLDDLSDGGRHHVFPTQVLLHDSSQHIRRVDRQQGLIVAL